MEFHFVSLKSGGAATIIDGRDKPRFICFKDRHTATKYASYICEYKAKFGLWPMVNLSTPFIKVRQLDGHKETDASSYMSLIDVVHRDEDDIDNMSLMTGVNYFYCHEFDHEDLVTMRIRGQDIDGYVDDFLYRKHMDQGLKNM